MQRITTCLWFDGKAEEAMNFYTSIFKNSKKFGITYYGDGMPAPKGSVMTVGFELDGREFLGLNGGPQFPFTHAISLVVNCETQAEIDHYWDKLLQGGAAEQCGWLRDKYGVSWQIVPNILSKLVSSQDQAKADRVMKAIMQMVKLDIAKLQQAADGK